MEGGARNNPRGVPGRERGRKRGSRNNQGKPWTHILGRDDDYRRARVGGHGARVGDGRGEAEGADGTRGGGGKPCSPFRRTAV